MAPDLRLLVPSKCRADVRGAPLARSKQTSRRSPSRSQDETTEVMVVNTHRRPHEGDVRRWRGRWFVAVAAAVAAIALIGGMGLAAATDNRVTPPTTYPGDGSREGVLVPDGVPSTTTPSELVASITLFHRGAYRLYADGRLLWLDETRSRPFGWAEQRLSPEGVERVRSRFLSSGLFDTAPPSSDAPTCQGWFQVCVRDRDRWLALETDPPPPGPLPYGDPRPEAVLLFEFLGTLDSTLAPTDWADQQVRTYVPSRIAACFRNFVKALEVPFDLPVLLPRFPQPVAALLAVRQPSPELLRSSAGPPTGQGSCFDLSLEDARSLADTLLSPSGRGAHEYWGIVVRFGRRPDPTRPGATRKVVAYVFFEDLLPEGAPSRYFGG
jgi:hypothetical protein